MSKENNLTDFLTDVADAIRAKKGTTEKINPQNFADEIKSLGAERHSVEWNDANFYDYDGTRLYSYTWDEAMAMTELPPLPTAKGLICQEWNYTLDDIKAQSGRCDISATYITDDGKTRLYIKIADEARMDIPLVFTQTVAKGVVVNWGDGSDTQTFGGTLVSATHKYAAIGNYCITLEVISGTLIFDKRVMSATQVYANMLKSLLIGEGVTSIGDSAFYNCYSLSSVVIPEGVTSIGDNAFRSCYALSSVIIVKGITNITYNAFGYCQSLSSVIIPNSVTSIGDSAFCYCYALSSVIIPNSVTSIENYAFRNCYSLSSVVIPEGVTSIGDSAFYYCVGVRFFDFSSHTSIPTLSHTNAFSNIASDCQFVVPDLLYDEWIAATNWSTYADRIVKASEYKPNNE